MPLSFGVASSHYYHACWHRPASLVTPCVSAENSTPALCTQIVPGFRVGIVPVLGTMPAIFGMAAASHILCHLAQQPFNPEPIVDITEQQYETQMARLLEREETKYGDTDGVAVDYSDVSLLTPNAVPPCPPKLCTASISTLALHSPDLHPYPRRPFSPLAS